MKNVRAIWMIAVSLLLGLAAVLVAGKWVIERTSVEASTVVIAAQDIDVGTRLTPDLLQSTDWPRASMPPGSFQDAKLLNSRVVRTNLVRGEPLLESKLAPEGNTGGLSGVIKEGKRAITVKVNEVIGLAGLALPGNKVDILVNTKDERDQPISMIVLEQILVLAVGQDLARDETKPKVVNAVTLEVAPEEAEKLDLARSVGTLSLVLRNQVDKSPGTTAGIRTRDLLRLDTRPAAAPAYPRTPAAPKQTIEIIRGIQKTEAKLGVKEPG
ncbi:MAG: Flp pilus assembly protein CpaB [Betaproteobacteria bacterium]|nr:Flp pilus assembly protein CpaB [Betaproteobacteria bacterium]